MLLLRDPAHHIETLQENKKFAEDLGKGHVSDFKYVINIPKGDAYTPVIRYKCVGSLRPVPLVSYSIDCYIKRVKPKARSSQFRSVHSVYKLV
jgi:hypothetical protein